MTDLEMTKLCAEAMGYNVSGGEVACGPSPLIGPIYGMYWNPLHDDAQAMALVKKFKICVGAPFPNTPQWECEIGHRFLPNDIGPYYAWATNDLNRAIVECVAKMQFAKESDPDVEPADWYNKEDLEGIEEENP